MENEKTNPDVVRIKLREELRSARELHREDALAWELEAKSRAEEARYRNRKYNKLVGAYHKAVRLSAVLTGLVVGAILTGGVVGGQILQEGDVSGMIIMLSIMLGATGAAAAGTQVESMFMGLGYEDEEE